jgi:hypothetical protein
LIGGLDNLTPMKVEIVLFFVGIMIVAWRGLAMDLTPRHRAVMLAILGLNPQLWDCKDNILSDVPFTFLLYLTLALAERVRGDRTGATPGNHVRWAIVLGSLVYLCYGTRTVGIVLIPVLLLLAGMRWRCGGRSLAGAAGVGLLLCMAQLKYLGGESSYLDSVRLPFWRLVEVIPSNVINLRLQMESFWGAPHLSPLPGILLLIVTLLALLAYVQRLCTGPRSYEIFAPLYLCIFLLWPSSDFRFLIPLIPLYLFYFLKGGEILASWLNTDHTVPVLAPLLVLISISYGAQFAHANYGPFKEGITKQETVQLFSFVRGTTNTNDVFIFRKPRAFALYTGRSASVYPNSRNASEICRYTQSIGATYLIQTPALDDPGFDDFLRRGSFQKLLVFSNPDFRVFQVRPLDLDGCIDKKM